MTNEDRIALLMRISAIDLRAQAGRPWPEDARRRREYLAELEADSRRRRLARIAASDGK